MATPDESPLRQTINNSSPPLPHVTLSLPPASEAQPTIPANAGGASSPLGRFEVLGEIGRGGMGVVLRAHDPGLGRDLAIKVLLTDRQGSAESRRRFYEEAQIGGQLQHPGLVPVYELGSDAAGRPFFVMKLVDGHTLADLLKARSNPADNLPRFLTIYEQICQALAYAHARGVIHRDLKPANVMVGAFGEVQVMDWGLAKVLSRPNQDSGQPERREQTTVHTASSDSGGSYSRAGSVLGTPAYMPPEQARGELDRLDARADVFGLGAILCEILTGQPPFTGRDVSELLRRAAGGDLTEPYARLDDCGADGELIRLARECLAAEPASRPENGAVVAARAAAYRSNVQERLRQAELDRTAAEVRVFEERKRRRTQLGLAGSLLLLLVLVGGGAWYLRVQQIEQQQAQERKQRELERALEQDLAEVKERQGQSRWTEAWAALERAEGRLGESGSDMLRERVAVARGKLEQIRTDREMVARLEEARIQIPGFPGRPSGETAYREAFTQYGLDVENREPESMAEKIRRSAIREELVSGLYQWAVALGEKKREEAERLARVGILADPDPWRQQLIQAAIQLKRETLLELAGQADPARLSPANAVLVAVAFETAGHVEKALPVLREVQRRHPDDFLITFAVAQNYLHVLKPAQPAEALRYYTAARALRPRNGIVSIELGKCYGNLYRPHDAVLAYREACRLYPDSPEVHNLLGYILVTQNDWSGAEAACREAIRIRPHYADALNNLSIALRNQGKLAEAEAVCRETIRLEPNQVRPHCSLGFVLKQQVKFEGSLDAFRKGHELASRSGSSRLPTSQWLHEAERVVELVPRLKEVFADKIKPASAAEEVEFADLCNLEHHHVAAARLYAEAFKADAKLANDTARSYRYKAVAATALAAAGKDETATALEEKERSRLRRQAFDWLHDDLAAWAKLLSNGKPVDCAAVYSKLNLWQQDAELATLRDKDALDRLPASERADWKNLWHDVHALQHQAAEVR